VPAVLAVVVFWANDNMDSVTERIAIAITLIIVIFVSNANIEMVCRAADPSDRSSPVRLAYGIRANYRNGRPVNLSKLS